VWCQTQLVFDPDVKTCVKIKRSNDRKRGELRRISGLSTISTYIEIAGCTGYINGSFVKTSNILYAVHFKDKKSK